MSSAHNGRTVVLGLGNPVLADDAAGLRAVAELSRLLKANPVRGVDVLASTRAGFELIDMLRGYSRAIIVDCLEVPEPAPGTVRRLTLEDVAGSARLTSQHEISVAAAFAMAAKLNVAMPQSVTIHAIEASDARTLSEDLSPEVAAAVPELAAQLHAELAASAPDEEPPLDDELKARRAYYAPEMDLSADAGE